MILFRKTSLCLLYDSVAGEFCNGMLGVDYESVASFTCLKAVMSYHEYEFTYLGGYKYDLT